MRDDGLPPGYRDAFIAQSTLLLDNFARLLGRDLIGRTGDAEGDARRLYAAPFAVLSHGTESDPVLNYANATALELWETTLETLLTTPSRLTAEPLAQDAREKVLKETAARGFLSGYSGIRISATGRRFRIANVTIWNLAHDDGRPAGQAATFDQWSAVT